MRLNQPEDQQVPFSFAESEWTEISQLTADVLAVFDAQLTAKQIVVDPDLPEVCVKADKHLIRTAICSLVENAMLAMPNGGDLSITLMNDRHQWELEIADSGIAMVQRWGEPAPQLRLYEPPEDCPTNPIENVPRGDEPMSNRPPLLSIVPVEDTPQLRIARTAARQHGGQIQTWDCPQGGTAHVLVVPKTQTKNAA